MTSLRALLIASCLSLSLSAADGRADAGAQTETAAPNMDQLFAALSRMPGLEARFTEEKHIALLAEPLVSQGHLYFEKPGLLLRRIEQPIASDVVVTERELRLKDASGTQQIDLASHKELKPFVESLCWVLAGNQKALAQVYRLSFRPQTKDDTWQLTLSPKGEPLSKLIASLVIRGKGYEVELVEVNESAGDKSVMRISEANPKRTFDAKERHRLFGVTAAANAAP